MAEAADGRIIVVDGLQRLTTFVRFLENQLRLVGLASNDGSTGAPHILEGKLFKELPITLQERVQDTPLTMYILDAKAPERARLDIFERVNSGEPLTRQQMRNALYNGPATVWLREAAGGDPFRSATGQSLNPKTMRDREAINRFCAFKLLGRTSYTTGDMDTFLAQGLRRVASLDAPARAALRRSFDGAMTLNRRLFGEHAFRKSLASSGPGASRSVINISLFEVCAVTMSEISAPLNSVSEMRLKQAVVSLVRDNDFERSITYSTNSTMPVQKRFSAMEQAVQEAVPL